MHRTARPTPLNFPLPAAPAYGSDRREGVCLPHLQQLIPVYCEAPLRDGLRTPPADEMATTYQPQYDSFARRQDAAYPTPSASANTYGGTYTKGSVQAMPFSSTNNPAPASTSTLRREVQSSTYPHIQPPSPQPASEIGIMIPEDASRRKDINGDVILPNLQIPSTINNSGGSLAEFAAQITCLFWFESTETLQKAEGTIPTSSPVKRLRDEALPSSGFRKWVVTILSTTQVTQNVILLALLFIYRLKKINPAVKGRSGSEYRLLTVALMLGNKFLDDNTYTNKTWAEVSGISVTEIHVMEVEFLSNMRYSLLASKEQWQEWQEKLGKFWLYCDRAAKAPLPQMLPAQAVPALNPTLPSPPISLQSSPPAPINNYHPISSSNSSPFTNGQNWPTSNYAVPVHSPLNILPDPALRMYPRKRSWDGELEEPAAKRVTRSVTAQPASFPVPVPSMRPDAPRLPVPNLTISTSQSMNHNGVLSQNLPLLPPLNGRAMSTVYPSTPTSWAPAPSLPTITPTGPPSQHVQHSATGYSTPSRRHSPHSHSVQELLSLGSSPISGNFPHNPGHISPSFFLQQRSSPYKPVRHVNTLLYPPPSASMQNYSANADHIHYQPLGKRNDYRAGVVPYAQGSYPHWPSLPQPNFHA